MQACSILTLATDDSEKSVFKNICHGAACSVSLTILFSLFRECLRDWRLVSWTCTSPHERVWPQCAKLVVCSGSPCQLIKLEISITLFHSSILTCHRRKSTVVNNGSVLAITVTVRQYAQNEDHETEAAKCNYAISSYWYMCFSCRNAYSGKCLLQSIVCTCPLMVLSKFFFCPCKPHEHHCNQLPACTAAAYYVMLC